MQRDEEAMFARPAFYAGGMDDVAGPGVAVETPGAHGQQVVNYFFPVEVIIEGSLSGEERGRIEEMIFASLTDALERMA
jgi:hypothetical protein